MNDGVDFNDISDCYQVHSEGINLNDLHGTLGKSLSLCRYVPGTRPDVFKTPQYKRNLQLHQMVQGIPNEINRLMFKELKNCEGHPEIVYTRYAITVGEFATSKILSNKLRRERKKKPSDSSVDSDKVESDDDLIDDV